MGYVNSLILRYRLKRWMKDMVPVCEWMNDRVVSDVMMVSSK